MERPGTNFLKTATFYYRKLLEGLDTVSDLIQPHANNMGCQNKTCTSIPQVNTGHPCQATSCTQPAGRPPEGRPSDGRPPDGDHPSSTQQTPFNPRLNSNQSSYPNMEFLFHQTDSGLLDSASWIQTKWLKLYVSTGRLLQRSFFSRKWNFEHFVKRKRKKIQLWSLFNASHLILF